MTSTGLPTVRFGYVSNVLAKNLNSPLGHVHTICHTDSPLYLEHCRLGHLSRESPMELAKDGKLQYEWSGSQERRLPSYRLRSVPYSHQ